jgi:hypothetical protein
MIRYIWALIDFKLRYDVTMRIADMRKGRAAFNSAAVVSAGITTNGWMDVNCDLKMSSRASSESGGGGASSGSARQMQEGGACML